MRELLKFLLLPPMMLFLAIGVGAVLYRHKHRAAVPLMAGAFGVLVLLCLPVSADLLMRAAQWGVEPFDSAAVTGAGAIVILSAGLDERAPEYGGAASVDDMTLARLRYGARLHRETHLPILVTGGRWGKRQNILGDIMAETLQTDFLVRTRWIERLAKTTRGNAEGSAEILLDENIDTVLLVTHAWHMARARRAFERAGLTVIVAPMGFERPVGFRPSDLVPGAKALHTSYYAVHELLGRVWYSLTA